MRRIFEVFLREIRLVASENSLLLTLLIAPILYSFIYGSIYLNKDQSEVPLAVVDFDQSALSRTLVSEINSSRKVEVHQFSSVKSAQKAMFHGEVQGWLEIPEGLERNVFSLKQSNINLNINSAQFLPSSAVLMSLNEIVLTVSAGARKTFFEKQGRGNAEALQMTNPVQFVYHPLFNEGKNYGTFLIPGLLAIILQQTLLIGLCAAMATEREEKTLKPLLKSYNFSEIFLGKGLFYWLAFMATGIFFVAVNFTILGAAFRGSYFNAFLLTGLFVGSIIVFSMLIGSFFRSSLMAFQVMGFSSYPIFMITGYSLPSQALPGFIQFISNLLPTTPFLKSYISVVQTGGNLAENTGHIVHLALLFVLYALLLMWRLGYLRRKV